MFGWADFVGLYSRVDCKTFSLIIQRWESLQIFLQWPRFYRVVLHIALKNQENLYYMAEKRIIEMQIRSRALAAFHFASEEGQKRRTAR